MRTAALVKPSPSMLLRNDCHASLPFLSGERPSSTHLLCELSLNSQAGMTLCLRFCVTLYLFCHLPPFPFDYTYSCTGHILSRDNKPFDVSTRDELICA